MTKQKPVAPTTWRNRIIGHGDEDPAQLLANPKNWRIHPKAQQDALAGVLNEVGWVSEVIVNKRTGLVVDGHLRVELAISREEPTIPVRYVDLDEAEEALVLATLDPLAGMAVAAKDQLDALLADVTSTDEAVNSLLENLRHEPGATNERLGLAAPVIKYEIIFDDEEQQQRWFDFLKWLRQKYPEGETIAGRLDAYLASQWSDRSNT